MKILPAISLLDRPCLDRSFVEGYKQFRKYQFSDAVARFQQALASTYKKDPYYALYLSYSGLASVYGGDSSGIVGLCRAATQERQDAEVFVNLALGELQLSGRSRAVQALEKGKRLDPSNRNLNLICRHVGMRREPLIPMISRNHPLNRMLGRISYRKPILRLAGNVAPR